MRHVGEKEYASGAAPWASSALPAVILSTLPSLWMERLTLHLSRASGLLLGPSSGGCGQPTRRPSSIGSSYAPPRPPTAAFLALASVVVMVGDVCAVSEAQAASFAVGIDLWMSSQKRYQ